MTISSMHSDTEVEGWIEIDGKWYPPPVEHPDFEFLGGPVAGEIKPEKAVEE